MNLTQFFAPKLETSIEEVTAKGLEILKQERGKQWRNGNLLRNRLFIQAIRETNLKLILSRNGHGSIQFFTLWRRGARKVKDISSPELASLQRFIPADIYSCALYATQTPIATAELAGGIYFVKDQPKMLNKLTSKEIRIQRSSQAPISSFKIGVETNAATTLTWSLRLSKVTSTKHKSIMLRVAHGDIYTQEKLFRYGMAQGPDCPRCGEIETLKHKFI